MKNLDGKNINCEDIMNEMGFEILSMPNEKFPSDMEETKEVIKCNHNKSFDGILNDGSTFLICLILNSDYINKLEKQRFELIIYDKTKQDLVRCHCKHMSWDNIKYMLYLVDK